MGLGEGRQRRKRCARVLAAKENHLGEHEAEQNDSC